MAALKKFIGSTYFEFLIYLYGNGTRYTKTHILRIFKNPSIKLFHRQNDHRRYMIRLFQPCNFSKNLNPPSETFYYRYEIFLLKDSYQKCSRYLQLLLERKSLKAIFGSIQSLRFDSEERLVLQKSNITKFWSYMSPFFSYHVGPYQSIQ